MTLETLQYLVKDLPVEDRIELMVVWYECFHSVRIAFFPCPTLPAEMDSEKRKIREDTEAL